MLLLSLCLKDSTDGEFLVSSGRLFQNAWLKGETGYSIVGILQGLSEGSSRYASYIDLYYQQLVVQGGEVFRCQRIDYLIEEDEFVFFSSRCETFPPCVRQ